MSVLEEIIEWSRPKPLWLRDALRRLVAQSLLTPADYEELILLCKQQRGISTPSNPTVTPRPIAERDIPQSSISSSTVILGSLRNLRGVNAIATDSNLTFSNSGLTVVYGDNATGKSGYVRILKQLCRTRGSSDPVLPNVFDATVPLTEADVEYSLNGSGNTFHWSTRSTNPQLFREVSIFDELSAGVYVDQNCEVAYLPFGLDLLPKLADVCNEVSRRIRSEIAQLDSNRFFPVGIPMGTRAADIVEKLDQRGIEQEVEQYASFDISEQQRLNDLTQTLARLNAESPQARAVELTSRATRFQTAREMFNRYLIGLSDRRVAELRNAVQLRTTTEVAARFAFSQAFSTESLPGIGTDTWRALWNAARQYSELQARPDSAFPPSNIGDQCVLCLQPLTQPALDRFRRFDEFIRTTLQADAERTRRNAEQMRQTFEALPSAPFLPTETLDELSARDSSNATALHQAQATLLDRRQVVLAASTPEQLDNLTALPSPPLDWLQGLETSLRAEAISLSSAAVPSERQRLVNEQNELVGKQILAHDRDQLITEIRRRSDRANLSICLHDTDTTNITRRNTELTDSNLISVLAERFRIHMQSLRIQHTFASISRGPGERGTAFHRIEISARRPIRASEILSRGEHRAIAIAAFLSELETQQSSSTVVFDDPVSSLDQDRRRYVATSLVTLATRRPVIVFTHDLFFLYLLRQQTTESGIELTPRFLRREGNSVGIVSEGFPWPGQNVRERIGVLRQRVQQATALFRRGANAEYEPDAKEIYGLLRESWERAVEEILFNNALTRFSPEIQTRRLNNVWGLEREMLTRLDNGMSKSSRWLTGHDTPLTAVEPVPDADELAADLLEFENWVAQLRQHHQRT